MKTIKLSQKSHIKLSKLDIFLLVMLIPSQVAIALCVLLTIFRFTL